jgi:hypothetical protein
VLDCSRVALISAFELIPPLFKGLELDAERFLDNR